MGTSRDIASALNFNSGLLPLEMGFDGGPGSGPSKETESYKSMVSKAVAHPGSEKNLQLGKVGMSRGGGVGSHVPKITKDNDMSDMGMTTDPPVSESQRKAMWAAKSGHSTLGIPQKVGAEFANADPGGKLPSHAKDEDNVPDKLYGVQNPEGGSGGPDNAVKVHDKVTDYEPKKGRWGGRAPGHANDTGPGLETAKAENNESGTGHVDMPTGRRGGRLSPHLRSGQSMDGGPGSGPQAGERRRGSIEGEKQPGEKGFAAAMATRQRTHGRELEGVPKPGERNFGHYMRTQKALGRGYGK